jgi:hypothetical protein
MAVAWDVPSSLGVLALIGQLSGPVPEAPITFCGIGPVRVGATLEAASRAAGEPLSGPAAEAGSECRYVRATRWPEVLFMVEKGRIVRVETRDGRYRTWSGARVGDPEATVRGLYAGRLEVTPHKYDERGHYLIVRSRDRRHALVLETDGEKVTRIRSGRVPAAEYVEGCS